MAPQGRTGVERSDAAGSVPAQANAQVTAGAEVHNGPLREATDAACHAMVPHPVPLGLDDVTDSRQPVSPARAGCADAETPGGAGRKAPHHCPYLTAVAGGLAQNGQAALGPVGRRGDPSRWLAGRVPVLRGNAWFRQSAPDRQRLACGDAGPTLQAPGSRGTICEILSKRTRAACMISALRCVRTCASAAALPASARKDDSYRVLMAWIRAAKSSSPPWL